MTSQTDRILTELYKSPVCSTTFLEMHMPRAAARISELRAAGHRIATERCNNPYHRHATRQVQYRLEEEG